MSGSMGVDIRVPADWVVGSKAVEGRKCIGTHSGSCESPNRAASGRLAGKPVAFRAGTRRPKDMRRPTLWQMLVLRCPAVLSETIRRVSSRARGSPRGTPLAMRLLEWKTPAEGRSPRGPALLSGERGPSPRPWQAVSHARLRGVYPGCLGVPAAEDGSRPRPPLEPTRSLAPFRCLFSPAVPCRAPVHCDEALACAMLKMLPEWSDAVVVRTRDETELAKCDVVVDVGGVYDPAAQR